MVASARFRAAYAEHRRAEGRGSGGAAELLALPYLRSGPFARQWAVRARSYEAFIRLVVSPAIARVAPRPLAVLDLGAGNGWLSYRLSRLGCRAVALDWRSDAVDGLGAARGYGSESGAPFTSVVASFDAIPTGRRFDVAVFNAAIHYAVSLDQVIAAATRVVVSGGQLVILDSPFYERDADGARMVEAKHARALREWGPDAPDLVNLPAIEYLTRERLDRASRRLGLSWRRHRVRYPLWYRLRPLVAALKRERRPSRFDLWETQVP
ncbi:MAG TPA: class I SAM-dependent methyltransferase [Gemmatimonadales bacterium]|nr:class I SAM-dependent methyltransferase [Gemmatimonadales bacterium]